MPRRRLGDRGPEVGALGFGCMALSGIYGEVDDRASVQLIHEALDSGITYLDTANSYGQGHNEELVGRAIAGRRDGVVLATKFGIQNEGLGRPDRIREALDASLVRIGTDYLDIYYMHRFDPLTRIEDSIGALGQLVDEGKIGHIGLSEISADRLRAAHAVYPITVVQQEYSLMSRDVEDELLPAMRELGVGLVAYSPLGRGMLGGTFRSTSDLSQDDPRRTRYPRYSEENLQHNLNLANAISTIANAHGLTPSTLALAWVLARGKDVIPIPGTSRAANLRSNIDAAYVDLDPSIFAELDQHVPKDAAAGERYNALMSRRLDR